MNSKALGLGGGAVLIILIALKVLPDLIDKPIKHRIKEERRADRGAEAEEVIGDILVGLNGDFFVLNDIANSNGNIDHIVIGKNSGVFLLETKAHGGQVEILDDQLLVNGKLPEKDFIGQALRNTYWLRDELERITGRKIWITPVIVFTNAFVKPGHPIKGVKVINKKYLNDLLQRPGKISSDLVAVWETRQLIAERL